MKYSFIMLDYPSLEAVAAIVREGSFERAAAALHITPSAVSQRVRGLEERLGAILIVRGQPCRATDVGAQLCAHVDRVRLLEADMAPLLGSVRDEEALTLRVAVNSDSLATWFPPAAAAFARETGMLLDLTLDDEKHTADRLRSGEVMAAVTAVSDPVQGCRTMSLGSLRYMACASPDFMARYFPDGVDRDSLARAPHICFDRRDALQRRWAEAAHGAEPGEAIHWVPSTQGFVDMTLAGLAWSMHPEVLAAPHIAAGRLVELPPGKRIDIDLYWMAARLHATPLASLTAAVRKAAGAVLLAMER